MLNNIIKNLVNKSLKKTSYGKIKITYPDNSIFYFGKADDVAEIKFNSWHALFTCLSKGDIGLAETYFNNGISSPDISKLIHFFSFNLDDLQKISRGKNLLKIMYFIKHLLKRNTINGSKKNITAHYDLGNQFYKLWLDETMTYSSALFDDKNLSLNDAQKNKYQRILDVIDIKPGERILEIGCGWGGFMEYAISKGYEVTGITISDEQYKYTKKRIEDLSSTSKVELIDYRNLNGKFDAVVSIEMFEAVGKEYWHDYFSKIRTLLKPKKKAIIQTITIDDKYFDMYLKSVDFIQSYIFPGGLMASDKVINKLASISELSVIDKKSFAQDYAKTLEIWNKSFQTNWDSIKVQGFNEKFKKLWMFYLNYCKAGFLSKRINVSQYTLS